MPLSSTSAPVSTKTLTTHRFSELATPFLPLLSQWRLSEDRTYQVPSDPAFDGLRLACLSARRAADRDIGLLLTDVGDLPPATHWLYRCREPLTSLLVTLAPASADLIIASVARTFDLLVQLRVTVPPTNRCAPCYREVRGHERDRPLFSLLASTAWPLDVRRFTDRPSAMRPAFPHWAPVLLTAFRMVEKDCRDTHGGLTASSEEALYRLGLSLRLFVQHGDLPAADLRSVDLAAVLRTFGATYAALQDRLPKQPNHGEVSERHVERVRDALGGVLGAPEARGGRRGRQQDGEVSDGEETFEAVELPAVEHRSARDQEPGGQRLAGALRRISITSGWSRNAERAGECPGDYDVEQFEAPLGTNHAALRMAKRRQEQRVPQDAIIFHFGREYLQPNQCVELYRHCFARPAADLDLATASAHTIVVGTLLTGIPAAEWLSLALPASAWRRVARLPLPARRTALAALVAEGWTVDVPWPLGYRTGEPVPWRQRARPVTDDVTLVFPDIVIALLVELLMHRLSCGAPEPEEDEPVPVFLRQVAPAQRLVVADVEQVVRQWGIRRPSSFLAKVARSFVGITVGRFGLDELDAAYASRQLTRGIATLRFYRHEGAEGWSRRVRKAANGMHAFFLEAARVAGVGLPGLPAIPAAPVPALSGGYGSCVVPLEACIAEFADAVEATLGRLALTRDTPEGFIAYHNLYIAYALVYFALATAGRPVRDGDYGAALALATGPRTVTNDKNSRSHPEPRTLAAMLELRQLRGELLAASRRALETIPDFDGLRYEELDEPLLFFLTPTGRPARATSDRVRAVLTAYPELAATFPYPLNVGRHALATLLAEAGTLDPQYRRYPLGHQRDHTEALGPFSLLPIAKVEAAFAAEASAWLRRCRLRVLPYHPEESTHGPTA